MSLLPYGSNLYGEHGLLRARLWTIPGDPPQHGYEFMTEDGRVLADGSVPKTHSGHRNPLHLLRDVLSNIDLDALGTDYITTEMDRSK